MGKKKKKKKSKSDSASSHGQTFLKLANDASKNGKEVFKSRFAVRFGAVSSRLTMYEDGINRVTEFDTDIDLMKLIL